MVEKAGTAAGLSIATTGDPGGRSDHATFVRQKIPSLHFFSGQHPDYHKPTDDADKINAVGGVKIASLVHAIAGDIAALDAKPTFAEVKTASSDQPTGTPTYRVVMGIAPGYGDDGKPGMAVEAVTPEGPADLAGLKTGDRIIRIGSKKVANIYDYMAATRGNKPGDLVDVVVLREEIEVALKVKLAPAR
jgi:C-terminal processing protease CtpA/Prc